MLACFDTRRLHPLFPLSSSSYSYSSKLTPHPDLPILNITARLDCFFLSWILGLEI